VILRVSFEELTALKASAGRVLDAHGTGGRVSAPAEVAATLETLISELKGDLSVETLEQQQRLERALETVLEDAKRRMDELIIDQYPAAEDAVAAYFEYAHVLTVLARLRKMGMEMRAIIELTTGRPADEKAARTVTFPD
jgi:hydrogenase maturation factor HypF (carbamoyltransferase family)